MKTQLLVTVALLAAALFGGCEAAEVSASKNPVLRPAAQNYAMGDKAAGDLNNQTFQNNKMFLWKPSLSPAVGTIVLRAGDAIDVNEDAGIAARGVMNDLQKKVSAGRDALDGSLTDDATKNAVSALYDLVDEKSTTATVDEFNDTIAKTESDLALANSALDGATQDQPAQLRQTLANMGRLGAARAQLDQADPNRDALQKQLDDMAKTLPGALPKNVAEAKSARDALLVTYEGNFRDRARSAALPKLVDDASKAVPALPAEAQDKKSALDALFVQKEAQFQVQYVIGKKGDALVALVINNTDYFNNTDSRVTFNFVDKDLAITISGFPEKGTTLSTENGTIDQVEYIPNRGRVHFDVHPAGLDQPFYRFKLGRTRTEISDGRLFYQGSMDLCVPNSNCAANYGKVLRHGIAKFVTSN